MICESFTQSTQDTKNIQLQFIHKDKVFPDIQRKNELPFSGYFDYTSLILS